MKVPKLNIRLAIGLFCLLVSAVMIAQVKTETSTEKGKSTVETTVERGEVVYVSGNDLVVKMEDGQIRNFPNVPDDKKITVDGKELTVHDLKPGMKLQRTITTTTTPQTVTTVKTVNGTVWHVTPPNTVVLTLEDGTNQKFTIPSGQKFNVNGKETNAWGLRKGMKVSATQIVATPATVTTASSKVTGEAPAPPPQVSSDTFQGPVLIVVPVQPAQVAEAKPPETPQAQTEAPATNEEHAKKELPQTAGELPLTALIGMLVLLSGAAMRVARTRRR